jgi:hypothetical protein
MAQSIGAAGERRKIQLPVKISEMCKSICVAVG